jgi:hypothetical protein
MAVWYIVDQRVPGIIVLSFFVATYRITLSIMANLRLLSRYAGFPSGGSYFVVLTIAPSDLELHHDLLLDHRIWLGGKFFAPTLTAGR